jgi:hypothetical protein
MAWHKLCSVIRYKTMNLYMEYMKTNAIETRRITKKIFQNISGFDPWRLRFEIVTAVVMKNSVFWDVAPFSRWKWTDVAEEDAPSILRVEEQVKQENSYFHSGFLLGLFFGTEDESYMFLRNVGWLPLYYTALYSRS